MAIKINNDNFEIYKKVYGVICHHVVKEMMNFLPPDAHPLSILENWEKKSRSLAKKGLQAGLNDILSWLKHCPDNTIKAISADLEKQALPDLKSLLNTISKTLSKVLSTGKIMNEDQYYIVKEVLDDLTSDVSEKDRQKLSKTLLSYELKISGS